MLSIIEIAQFRQYLINKLDIEEGKVHVLVEFYRDIPKSSIVLDENGSNFYKFSLLCQKYIYNSADHCVNLSYDTRTKLIDFVNNEEKFNQLNSIDKVKIFDQAIKELVLLIKDSFSRFLRSEECENLLQITFIDSDLA